MARYRSAPVHRPRWRAPNALRRGTLRACGAGAGEAQARKRQPKKPDATRKKCQHADHNVSTCPFRSPNPRSERRTPNGSVALGDVSCRGRVRRKTSSPGRHGAPHRDLPSSAQERGRAGEPSSSACSIAMSHGEPMSQSPGPVRRRAIPEEIEDTPSEKTNLTLNVSSTSPPPALIRARTLVFFAPPEPHAIMIERTAIAEVGLACFLFLRPPGGPHQRGPGRGNPPNPTDPPEPRHNLPQPTTTHRNPLKPAETR